MLDFEAVFALYRTRGHERYGESVTQLEHALQCAMAAETAGAAPELITAALLHDLGHLLHRDAAQAAALGIDDRHEALGAKCLDALFGSAVARPVALHVAAKRYLCRQEPGYRAGLSAASEASLAVQGGTMDPQEAQAFEAEPFARSAVALRRWDEAAKVPGAATPDLAHFRAIAAACRRA